jgi:anti-sigma factor RsiW
MEDDRHELHVLARLQAWRDGELPVAAAEAVRAHLAACPDCAGAARELDTIWDAIAVARPPVAPRPAWPGLRASFAGPRRTSLPWAAGLAAATAGLLVGLLVGEPGRAGARVAAENDDGASEWAGTQTLVVAGAATTLDGIYLDTTTDADEAPDAAGGAP